MQRIAMAVFVGALLSGSLATAQPAIAAGVSQTTNDTVTVPTPTPGPAIQLLDCAGTTGNMGCGPGWFWRDGWRGYACYPC